MSESMSRKRSLLWQYFVPVAKEQARCLICQSIMSFKGRSTANLTKHVKARHGVVLSNSNGNNNSASEESELVSAENSSKDFVSVSEIEQDSGLIPIRSRATRSSGIWLHFTALSNIRARCDICQTEILVRGGSTSNMSKHLRKQHKWLNSNDHSVTDNAETLSEPTNHQSVCYKELATEVNLANSAKDSMPQSTIEQDSCSHPIKRGSKRRSSVWLHFTLISDIRARCEVCKTEITFRDGSTSNLAKHLRKQHKWLNDNSHSTTDNAETQSEPTDQSACHKEFTNEVELVDSVKDFVPKSKIEKDSCPIPVKRGYRRRSSAWLHFTLISDIMASCDVCKTEISYRDGSTSNLAKHLRKQHKWLNNSNQSQAESSEAFSDLRDQSACQKELIKKVKLTGSEEYVPQSKMEQDSCSIPDTRGSKRRSSVWLHFTSLSDTRARCNICEMVIAIRDCSTSNMLKHLRLRHKLFTSDHSITESGEEWLSESVDQSLCHKELRNEVKLIDCAKDIMPQSKIEQDSCPIPVKRGAKRRSSVWLHFTSISDIRARCNICEMVVSVGDCSTSNMLKHLRLHHQLLNNSDQSQTESSEVLSELTDQPTCHKKLAIEEPQSEIGQDSCQIPVKSGSKRHCSVWLHFTSISDIRARCNICDTKISIIDGSTSNMSKHLRLQHKLLNKNDHSTADSSEVLSKTNDQSVCHEELTAEAGLADSANDFVPQSKMEQNFCPIPNKRGAKRHSSVWLHFTSLSDTRACCNICEMIISCKDGSTSGMLNHLRLHRKLMNNDDHLQTESREVLSELADQSACHKEHTTTVKLGNCAKGIMLQSKIEQDSGPNPETRGSKRRSSVWLHFTSLSDIKARCDICERVVSIRDCSTSNMLKHLRLHHKLLNDSDHAAVGFDDANIKQKNVKVKQNSSSLGVSVKTEPIDDEMSEADDSSLDCSTIIGDNVQDRDNKLDDLLLRMFVVDLQPFSIVEEEGFRNFVYELDEKYCLPSKSAITEDLIPAAYKRTLKKLQSLVSEAVAVSVAANTWTTSETSRYLNVMISCITNDFTHNVLMLDCSNVGNKPSAQELSSILQRILNTCIQNKTQAVVTDTTYGIKEAVELIGQNHFSCLMQTINDLVEAGMSTVQALRRKAESIYEFFQTNVAGAEKLQALQNEIIPEDEIVKLKLCDHSWNSVYCLFRQLCSIKGAIADVTLEFNDAIPQLDQSEWTALEEITSICVPFESVLKEVQLDKALSASKVIPIIHGLTSACRKIKGSVKTYTSQCMINVILQILEEQFFNCENNVALACATFLDPRFKGLGFNSDSAFTRVNENIISELRGISSDVQTGQVTGSTKSRVKSEADSSLIWEEFDMQVISLTSSESSSRLEVQRYIDEPNLGRGEDALMWWKERTNVYPRLAKIACKYLCIVATIPNKALVSQSNKCALERRNRYSSKYLPTVTFLGANIDAL